MSDEQFKKSVWERIHTAQDEHADLADRYDALMAEIEELGSRKLALEVKISNWQELVTDAEKNTGGTSTRTTDASQEVTRRMRLGAKKRVIYQMVSDGLDSLESLDDVLKHSNMEIDTRYVREVVRTGMAEGDFSGELEGNFTITESGKGILAKAPKPRDWMDWERALSDARLSKSSEDYR